MKVKKQGVVLGGMEGVKLRLLRAREKEKKQEKELSEREHPKLTKFKERISKIQKKAGEIERSVERKISKKLKEKLVSRKVLKPGQVTFVIKKQEPHSILREENRFFKDFIEQENRSLFFN